MADEMDNLKNETHATGDTLRQDSGQAAHQAKHESGNLVDKVMGGGNTAGHKLGDFLGHAADAIMEAPNKLGEAVGHGSHDLSHNIHNAGVDGIHKVEHGAGQVTHHDTATPHSMSSETPSQTSGNGETTV